MADIFEIKGVDAIIRVPQIEKEYQLADPPFMAKVALQKKFTQLQKERDKFESAEFLEKMHEFNCEQIKLYLPDMTDEDIGKLGGTAFLRLLNSVIELATTTFGAIFTKVESAGKTSQA